MPQPMRIALAAALVLTAGGCNREEPARAAKDAPYVPTPDGVVAELLQLAAVGPDDFVIDLGAGDGRIVIAAAKRHGAGGLGVEIDPELVELANANARRAGVIDQVSFVEQDLFETDLSQATVVTMYLLPEMVNALKDKLVRELEPGSRVVSHDYAIDGWHSMDVVRLDVAEKVEATGVTRTRLYLYVVPARIAGRWTVSLPDHPELDGLVLDLEQDVTLVRGRAIADGVAYEVIAVPLNGRELELHVPRLGAVFSGRIGAAAIEGTASIGDRRGGWRAERAGSPPDAG